MSGVDWCVCVCVCVFSLVLMDDSNGEVILFPESFFCKH